MKRAGWLLALLLAPPLAAQQVDLRLRDGTTSEPVAGALVRLVGEGGVVMQTLSNEAGRAVLRAAAAGIYRIRVDRIGMSGTVTEPFALRAGETVEREIALESRRLTLPPIEVEGRSLCGRRSGESSLAALLWEEIEKALHASVIAERLEVTPLLARRFRRELDRDGRPIRAWVEDAAPHRGRWFTTPPPAFLLERGFVFADVHDSVNYAAPDVHLLLSEEFVSTHCFRAVPGQGGLVGLGFEPVPGRKVPEVRGTLWVERETSELRFLEYEYTGLGREVDRLRLGGRVELRRLPTGSWIVSYWHVRTPWMEALPSREHAGALTRILGRPGGDIPDSRIRGFMEVGGLITPRAGQPEPFDRAVVVGEVRDSLTGGGLAGAVVRVTGARDSAVSDSAGRFVLLARASGDREIVAAHPALAVPGSVARAERLLSLGDTVRVAFAVPSLETLVRPHCGRRRNGAAAVGVLASEAERVEIQAEWRTPTGAVKTSRDRPGKDGVWALCGLPADERITVRLLRNRVPLVERVIEVEWGGIRWVEFPGF